MPMISARPLLRLLLLAAPLAACVVGPDYRKPAADLPAAWSAAAPPAAVAPPPESWWTGFADAELTSLITRAAAANLDARAAVLRLAEARAQRAVAGAAQWPNLGANAAGQVTRLSESTPTGALFSKIGQSPALAGVKIDNPYEQYQIGFDAAWEVDLFGHVRRSVEAAGADSDAAAEDSRAVLVSVLGDVGRAYIDLRRAQVKRCIAQDTLTTERGLLDLAGQRRAAGLGGVIDMDRAAAEAAGAEAQLPLLDQQITADINQLSRLVAREPGALRSELETSPTTQSVAPAVTAGLPADLARRRPDIRAAEARLHAATARVGVAVADLFPRVTLAAQGGLQAQSLTTLTHWASRFVNAGPNLELPVFDAGRRRATVRLQTVREREAALDYQRVVLGTVHEADTALAARSADEARRISLSQAAAHDREAADLARQRYAGGVGSFIEVLGAERARQQNDLALADATAAVSIDTVVIYKALGGGWSEAATAAPDVRDRR